MDEQLMAPGWMVTAWTEAGGGFSWSWMALQVVQTPDIAGGNIGGIWITAFRVKAKTREGATEIAEDRLGNHRSYNRQWLRRIS